jgi:hypothetical protein
MPEAPKNFFTGNKFKFSITGERFKDNEFDVMVTSLNIPGFQIGVIERATTIRTLKFPGDALNYNDLTVEFIVSENLEEWITIFQWMHDLRDSTIEKFNNTLVADASLVLLTNKVNPNIVISFEDIFPFDLTEIPLQLEITDPDPVRVTASFKYQDMKIITEI